VEVAPPSIEKREQAKLEVQSAIAFLGRPQTTSVGPATLASRLAAFGAGMVGDPVIRYPRHMNREFNTDNFVLLGTRLTIPREVMFDASPNFPLIMDRATHHLRPRNRGKRTIRRKTARSALLPILAGTGTVLLLNGIDMVAAEAAGEFAMDGSLAAARGVNVGERLRRDTREHRSSDSDPSDCRNGGAQRDRSGATNRGARAVAPDLSLPHRCRQIPDRPARCCASGSDAAITSRKAPIPE
jgi:hypothetical protein